MTMHIQAECRPTNPTEEAKSREALEAFVTALKPDYIPSLAPASAFVDERTEENGYKVLSVDTYTHFD
jgi:hypothetical protein